MSRPKISVIMPVYKVEGFVAKAIESIQKQTLTDFEFLIVDDGSPDKSGEICDEYAKRDSRIKVIHKENAGAPSARNIAIDVAQGEYLYFMDSDDWAEPMMLKSMYDLAQSNNAQLVAAGFFIDTYYSQDGFITTNYIPEEKVYTTKEEFRKDAYKLFDKNILYTPWNKLYLSKYIKENKFYFPKVLWDDFPFNLNVIRDIECVVVTSKQFYHFLRVRAESETSKYVPQMYEKREEEHSWLLELYNYWGVKDHASMEMLARRYVDRLIGCFENLTNPNCTLNKKEKKQKFKKMITSKRTQICVKIAEPKAIYTKIMYLPVKLKCAMLMEVQSRLITYIKLKDTKLFARLKARR